MSADTAMDWEFAVLGALSVRHRGTVVPIPAERQRTLLATLLLDVNETVTVSDLVDRLWSDGAPRNATAAVQSLVMRLRRALGPDGEGLVRTRARGYALEVPAAAVDLARFDALRDLAREAERAGDQLRRSDLLREALGLWRGEPLADIASDVLRREEVPALVERRLHASEEYFDAELALGRHAEVVPALREATARHPLREGLWSRLMVALYRSERQAEALDAYRRLSGVLADELGLDPGPGAREVQRAILHADPRLRQPPPDPGPVSTQVPPTAPVPAAASPLFQLPADPGVLHGRAALVDTLLAQLAAAADQGRLPLVCLSGAPGVGKTALAVHVARLLGPRHPDGQWYVRLRGKQSGDRDPADLLTELLGLAGVRGSAVPEGLDARAAAWRAALAGRRVVLVLDDAADARQVEPLLPGDAGCAVLVTSRTKLGGLVALHGARATNLDTLSPADAADLLRAVFAEHGTDAEPALVAELAALCGHLPLALRIAAANIATNAPEAPGEYVRQLRGDRLSALAVDGDSRVGIRAALEPSYRRLGEPARRALGLLASAPTDDFTVLDAAALLGGSGDAGPDDGHRATTVAGPPPPGDPAPPHGSTPHGGPTPTGGPGDALAGAEAVLRELATAHLVRQLCPRRYELHDLIRLYATERSLAEDTPGERAAGLARLFGHYLVATDAAARRRYPRMTFLPPPEGAVPAALDLERWFVAEEYRNLLTAVRHAAEHGPPGLAWQLADRIRGYQQELGAHADWRAGAEAGLARARREGSALGEATMQLSLGTLSASRADHTDAQRRFEASLELYADLGNLPGQASVSNNLGIVHREQGQLAQARTCYDRALRLYRALGNRRAELSTLSNLGVVQLELDQIDAAIRSQATALEGYGSWLDDDTGTALHNLGVAARAQGRPALAVVYLTRALAVRRRLGNDYGVANELDGLAASYTDLGYHAKALTLVDECLVLARRVGRRRLESEALTTRGAVLLGLGDPPGALADLRAALRLSAELGYPRAGIMAHTGLALAYAAQGRDEPARRHARDAEALAGDAQHHRLARYAREALAGSYSGADH